FLMDELLENHGAAAEMAGGDAHIGADCLANEIVGVVSEVGFEKRGDGGTDPVDDRPKIPGLTLGRALQLLQGGEHGATAGVAEDDHQAGAVLCRGKLYATDLRRRDDVAGDANHEEVAQPLVENDLRGDPGV